MSEDRALAAPLSEDRWVPSTAHIVLLTIVVLLTRDMTPLAGPPRRLYISRLLPE
jgi:hypothetical protein